MSGHPGKFGVHLATALALFFVATAGVMTFMVIGGGISKPGEKYEVKAVMPTVASLVRGSRVTMSGAEVGRVQKVERVGLGARVTLKLDDDSVFPLPADSRIRLRQHTPVGENYISIDPGSSKQVLPDGATVPVSSADDFVDVDQVLSTLSGPTRDRARELITSLGTALDGRGRKLNRVVRGLTGTIIPTADLIEVAHRDRQQVTDLVRQLDRLMAGVGERDAAIRTIADDGLQAVRAIGNKDAALRRTLEEVPAMLDRVRKTSGTVDEVTHRAAPVLNDLAAALIQVRPAVRTLEPAAATGRSLMAEVGRSADPVRETLGQVRTLSGPTVDALPKLNKAMCEINPAVDFFKPYTKDLAAYITDMGSSANAYDAIGHTIRLIPVISENQLTNLPASLSKDAFTLLRTGLIGKASPLTYYPYPKPGEAGKTARDLPSVYNAKDLAKSGYKYPRVEAAC